MSHRPPLRAADARPALLERLRADCLGHLDAIYRGALRLTGNRLDAARTWKEKARETQ